MHSPDISRLAELICHHPTWVDLKGKDAVPETVHHAVVRVNPEQDELALMSRATVHAKTDGAAVGFGSEGPEEARAERLKRLKPQVNEGSLYWDGPPPMRHEGVGISSTVPETVKDGC